MNPTLLSLDDYTDTDDLACDPSDDEVELERTVYDGGFVQIPEDWQ